MIDRVLMDAGPLVAYLNRREQHHSWARKQWRSLAGPLLTCEAVLAEACFLLRGYPAAEDALLGMIEESVLQIPFAIQAEAAQVRALRLKYQDVPMSLADACLVRMAELIDGSTVCTLDSDFALYRKGRRTIPLMRPGA